MTTFDGLPTPTTVTGQHGYMSEWTPAILGPLAAIPTKWAVEHLIPLGQPGILVGAPADGKTYVALQAAAAIASGSQVFGIQVDPGPVLFLEFEDSPSVIAQRLDAISEGISPEQRRLLQENFRLWTPGAGLDPRFTTLAPAIYKRLLELGVKAGGGGVLVIDTLAATSSGSENEAASSRELWAVATWLAQDLGIAVLFLHHTRKRDPRAPWNSQGLDAIRGSSAQAGSTRFVLQLSRTKKPLGPDDGQPAKLTVVKINCAPPGFTLNLVRDPQTGLWSRQEDPEVREPVYRALASRARSPTPKAPVRKGLLQLLASEDMGNPPPSRQQLSISLFGDAEQASLAKLRGAFRDLRLKGWVDPNQDILTPAGLIEHNSQTNQAIPIQTHKDTP